MKPSRGYQLAAMSSNGELLRVFREALAAGFPRFLSAGRPLCACESCRSRCARCDAPLPTDIRRLAGTGFSSGARR